MLSSNLTEQREARERAASIEEEPHWFIRVWRDVNTKQSEMHPVGPDSFPLTAKTSSANGHLTPRVCILLVSVQVLSQATDKHLAEGGKRKLGSKAAM